MESVKKLLLMLVVAAFTASYVYAGLTYNTFLFIPKISDVTIRFRALSQLDLMIWPCGGEKY